MSANYLNLDQLIEKLVELKNTGLYNDDIPVYYSDSSGYDYYVKNVVVKEQSIVIE